MRRHWLELCALLSFCVLGISPTASAQQAAQLHRVGMLFAASPTTFKQLDLIKKEFRDRGYVEGQNLLIDLRWAEGQSERLPALAADLVALKPDVIMAFTSDAALAAKEATTSIPIVFSFVGDPVGSGLTASFAHPGGNITGVGSYGADLAAKRVEFVHTVAPKATRIGVLTSDSPTDPPQVRAAEAAAKSIGLVVVPAMDRSNDELERTFASWAKSGVRAVIALGGGVHQPMQRTRMAELAMQYRMPMLCSVRVYAESGCLMSYGPNLNATYRLSVGYVDKILKGAKPAELPVEQPSTLEMVINLKTAKALRIAIPQSVLARADEVIQ